MPRFKHTCLTPELGRKCRELVFEMAKRFEVPPVYITAHIRNVRADEARKEVWRIMISRFGMSRQLVATIFKRDRRRLRASVLDRKVKRTGS